MIAIRLLVSVMGVALVRHPRGTVAGTGCGGCRNRGQTDQQGQQQDDQALQCAAIPFAIIRWCCA